MVKLDSSDGTAVWAKAFGDAGYQADEGLATDAEGNVIVTGCLESTMDFGKGPLVSSGGEDLFVAKLDPSGEALWSMRAGDGADQRGMRVATDPDGNVIVVGSFSGTLDFGGGHQLSAAPGEQDVFVVKLAR